MICLIETNSSIKVPMSATKPLCYVIINDLETTREEEAQCSKLADPPRSHSRLAVRPTRVHEFELNFYTSHNKLGHLFHTAAGRGPSL